MTLERFAERFAADHLPSRNLKRSTLVDYDVTIRKHLIPMLGGRELVEIERRPELVERYVVAKLAEGLSAKTVRNHLALLGRMFRVAIRWRLVRSNPVEMIEMPKAEDVDVEPEVLTEVEVARLIGAYRELEAEAMVMLASGGRWPAGSSWSRLVLTCGGASCSVSGGVTSRCSTVGCRSVRRG